MFLHLKTVGHLTPRTRHPRFTLAVGMLLIALTGAKTASAAELIQNGDFEAGGGNLAGWTVGGNVVTLVGSDYVSCCGTTGSEPNFSSNHFAAFGAGDTVGVNTLSQTFATIVGATYHLSFSSGALGLPGEQGLIVTPIGSYVGGGLGNTVKSDFNSVFSGLSVDFIADEALTTLAFTVKSLGPDGNDEILDQVSVTGPSVTDGGASSAPEPASWALMLGGFAALGATLRGRRAALA